MPSRGTLRDGVSLPRKARGLRWLRNDSRHFGVPRFVNAIVDAAARVDAERPGADVSVGDLSLSEGGVMLPHFSHRSGRDADLLFYTMTLDGTPTESPGFVTFGPDGLANDEAHHRFLRLDVGREWLIVRALLSDPEARVQWMFIHHTVRDMLLAWAEARGEPQALLERARVVMHEPHPGGAHDDHIHVRTSCAPSELRTGCEQAGPVRPWLDMSDPPSQDSPEGSLVLPVARLVTEPQADLFLLAWSSGP